MQNSKPTIQVSLERAAKVLTLSGDTPQLDAELLLAEVLQCERSFLHTRFLTPLTQAQVDCYNQLISRRAEGEPVAYILGKQEFWTLNLTVSPSVLIPRPETELLIESLLELPLPNRSHVLDLGTGSGAIAIALSTENPLWTINAVDNSSNALAIAKANAKRYGITDKQIQFIQSDWFYQLSANNQYDAIVCNPPYIAPEDHHLLPLRYEPQNALVAQAQGLEHYISICQQASRYLKQNGILLFEHGYNQRDQICQLLQDNQFEVIVERDDLNHQPRICGGQLTTIK